MITCKLGEKTYSIDYVSGRALREINDALVMYGKIVMVNAKIENGTLTDEDVFPLQDALDVMVKWFCLLFKNQFTPDEVFEHYPVDDLLYDITYAIQAVNAQMTKVLSSFPIRAAQAKTKSES